MARRHVLTTALLLVFLAGNVAASDPGLVLGSIRKLDLSGRLVDAASNAPVVNAEVFVNGESARARATTGPDGSFVMSVTSDRGLGTVDISVNHAEYRQRYFEAALADLAASKVDVTVARDRTNVRAGKNAFELACGATGTLETRTSRAAQIKALCEGEVAGVDLAVGTSRLAVLGREPFSLRVGSGRIEVRDTSLRAIAVRMDLALTPR